MGNRLTTKGQVTIPKAVRDDLGLRPGDEVDFVRDDGGFRIQRKAAIDGFAQYRGTSRWLAGKNVDDLIEEMRGR